VIADGANVRGSRNRTGFPARRPRHASPRLDPAPRLSRDRDARQRHTRAEKKDPHAEGTTKNAGDRSV
jgi:hypothetical protein